MLSLIKELSRPLALVKLCLLLIFCLASIVTVIGAVAYWLFGYAFGFGEKGNGFIGYSYFALADLPAEKFSHWFFHYVFAASTATIVSGSLAERTEFKAYLMYSVFLTGKLSSDERQSFEKVSSY